MKIIGIIAEYNPLHWGHIYQIKETKKKYPDSLIILITNTYFTQRGDVSIINKYDKTELALENDIDLVVELPFAYATQSADIFAYGALYILNQLKIDTLIFGSESNELEKLLSIAKTQLKNKEYDIKVKEYLNTGINYPTALNKALIDILGISVSEPNDLLGISYIKEIMKRNYSITPESMKRIGSYHAKEPTAHIANATLIRKMIHDNQNILKYIPEIEEKLLNKTISLDNYFPYLKYKILSTNNLDIFQTIDEGIENRIKKAIKNSYSWNELVYNIKTKRYTYNKINRALIHVLTSFTKEEAKSIKIDYIKILGFNIKGRKYLNKIKKNITLPLIYNYKENISKLLDIEQRAATIYYLPINEQLIKEEYKAKPTIKKET